jgi:hypothetical protein
MLFPFRQARRKELKIMDNTFNQSQTKSFGLIHELRARNPLLFDVGAAHIILLLIMMVIAPFDGRQVMGINPWIKPMKFAASIAIYLLTMGWLLYELPLREKVKRRVNWAIVVTLVIEIVLITMQAARGVTSHFNDTTAFDIAVFAVMGASITFNILVAAYVALMFWRTEAEIPAPYLWGIRIGLTIFVLASLEGFAMVNHSAHSVGVPDGGPGLPFVNWSTTGGDLRIAHFFGMHALQVLPLAGYLLSRRWAETLTSNAVRWVQALAVVYALIALLLFLWAMAGRPLVPLS